MKFFPQKSLGIWSVGLTFLFLLILAVFFTFMFLGLVTFDEGNWWDITVGVSVIVETAAFILSIIAVGQKNDRSVSTYISMIIGILLIVFLFTHSLYIRD